MSTNPKRVAALWAAAISALLAQACVTSPYNGEHIDGIAAPMTIAGFYHQPDVPLTIEVANSWTGVWEVIGTTTSGSTPTIEAETWKNSPPLYYYSAEIQVSDPDDPHTLERWNTGASHDVDTLVATLRVRSGDSDLATGDEHSVSCVQNAPPTADFYSTATHCGFRQGPVWIQSVPPSTDVRCKSYGPKRCAQEGWCDVCDYGCTVCKR